MKPDLISDIKKYVNYLLVPLEDLYYHHYEHALSVMQRAVYLGKKEGCSDEDIQLLTIASLFHDTGFVIQYDDNEIFGAKIAQNYLRTILFDEEKISIIQNIILATKLDSKPQNLLEEIIKDADMDNLGREDFFDVGEKLKREREIMKNIKIKDPDWHHASLDVIQGYTFYTHTQISERSDTLRKNTEKLQRQVETQS